MSENLAVDAAGLQRAAEALTVEAHQLTGLGSVHLTTDKPSVAGAAKFAAAVESFSAAYSGQVARHARNSAEAATRYTAGDDDSAVNISSVSI